MYTCPMHPEIRQVDPGRCPICGMELALEDAHISKTTHATSQESYTPLVVIISLIALVTATLSIKAWLDGQFSLDLTMRTFMAGFFLIFSSFKLIDIKGFAEGYYTYDLLARHFFKYGYIYPFLELLLGLSYLLNLAPVLTNSATLILLTFSGIGVLRKILSGQKIQCACLGTFLKVPLSKVTVVEDFSMAAMALIMLLIVI